MKEEDVSKAVSEVISLNRTALDEYKNPPDQRHNHANIVKNFQQEYTAYLETWAFKLIRWFSQSMMNVKLSQQRVCPRRFQ